MICLLKLLVLQLVLIDFKQLNVEAGYTSWKVLKEPLVFGGDVVIQCAYHNNLSCTAHSFWTWTTDPNNELIMTNGTFSEKHTHGKKYSEIRSSCTQVSNLVISNFSEGDYWRKYKCGIAVINSTERSFVEYPKDEITFENISYEYVPAQKMVSTVLNPQISFRLEIDKIYPVPECQATFAGNDVTDTLKVQKKEIGLFYKVAYTFTSYHMRTTTFGDFCIRCYGNRSRSKILYRVCSIQPGLTKENNHISYVEGFYLAAIVFVGIFYTLYPVSVVIVMIRLYFASTDQFDRLNQILSRIENISYVCIGSCFMFGVMSIGGVSIQGRPELPIQLVFGMHIFCTIAMSSPVICCIPISLVDFVAKLKLSEERRYMYWSPWMFETIIHVISLICQFGFEIFLFCMTMKLMVSFNIKRRYGTDFFGCMAITDMFLVLIFLFAKFLGMKSIKELHKTRDERMHRNTETHALLMDKEHDAGSFVCSVTNMLLVDKKYDDISVGSSGSYSSTNDGEMCVKETAV